jgi:Flp pilus assembly protein TadG
MQIAAIPRSRSKQRRQRRRGLLQTVTRASVAIEFAILALAFLSVMPAIVDTGLLLSSQALLDSATSDAARLILIGQASRNGAVFGSQLCSEVSTLMACPGLTYRVQTGAASPPYRPATRWARAAHRVDFPAAPPPSPPATRAVA